MFDDLDAAVEAEQASERAAEVADRVVAERGRLRLVDRLRPLLGAAGHEIACGVAGQQPLRGRLTALGADWLTLARTPVTGTLDAEDGDGHGGSGQEWLVPLARIAWLRGAGPDSAEPGSEGVVGARLTFRLALRRLLRDGFPVVTATVDGSLFAGTITTVGHDHVEVSQAGGLTGDVIVPIEAIGFVGRG